MDKQNIKILLVDDEPDILEIVGFNLESEGYQIFKAENGKKALEIAQEVIPNLIILDVMMPEMDGIETCDNLRKIASLQNTIITFLTARSEDYSQVAGLSAGADDYITKPIKPKVLRSKVESLLRRIKTSEKSQESIINLKSFQINRDEYKVLIDSKELNLPKKEFELLCLLVSKPDKVFKREVIMDKVWGNEVVVGGRTIDVHIRKLREKIGDDFFQTVKGVGYKFIDY